MLGTGYREENTCDHVMTSSTFAGLVGRDALRAEPLVQDVEHLPAEPEEEQREGPRRHRDLTNLNLVNYRHTGSTTNTPGLTTNTRCVTLNNLCVALNIR